MSGVYWFWFFFNRLPLAPKPAGARDFKKRRAHIGKLVAGFGERGRAPAFNQAVGPTSHYSGHPTRSRFRRKGEGAGARRLGGVGPTFRVFPVQLYSFGGGREKGGEPKWANA